jgi:hypothetical protein
MARYTLRMRLSSAACWLLVAPSVLAQTIVATNSTDADPPGTTGGTPMTISRNDDMVPLAPVLPLTNASADEVPPTGISGEIIDVGVDNQFDVKSGAVALISCDSSDYPGNIDQAGVYRSAVQRNVAAVLFYSQHADYCRMDGDQTGYKWVFSMKSRDDTRNVLNAMANSSAPLWVTIGGPEAQQGRDGSSNGTSGSNSNTRDNGPQGPLGPNPSTAVAMIILYTITGVITALFLVIIVTGAIRAHRHPERYGPRAIVGRPRQSRARGIGRAILDGIPIVKFGEREEPKPADVEMGTTASAQENRQGSESSTGDRSAGGANTDGTVAVDGIAAAGATSSANANDDSGNQGCSICTEDFERGQDQRVLPCDHRFHPECIDPWLLNVSGTCPLCRVDLRPQRSHTSQDVDENGNPIPRENDEELGDLPPPVVERSSVRRSLMIGILGIGGRPDRMTREERVMALRRYRQRQAARRRRESGNEVDGPADPQAAEVAEAQDRSTRQRLRNLLGVRTRRTGQDQTAAETTGDAAASTDNTAERR